MPHLIPGVEAATSRWISAPDAGDAITVNLDTTNNPQFDGTIVYVPSVRVADTALMIMALLLAAGAYYLMILHATPLGNFCKLPSRLVNRSLQVLLGEFWPSDTGFLLEHGKTPLPRLLHFVDSAPDYHVTLLDSTHHRGTLFRSVSESVSRIFVNKSAPDRKPRSSRREVVAQGRLLWLRSKSAAVKNLVLLAIWEWVSLWLVGITVIGTAIFNGIAAGGDGNPDKYPRLGLMLAYAAAFLVHFAHTWACISRTYTNLALNGCWTLLSNAHFGVTRAPADLSLYESPILGATSFSSRYTLRQRGVLKIKTANNHGHLLGKLVIEKEEEGHKAPDGLVDLQEAETKNLEKSTEVALERVIFNATILLGISIVTGFSTWTQSHLLDATSTQLGSLALLASTASGLTAMLSSAQHLNGISASSWRYLEMTELILSGKEDAGVDKTDIGFTKEEPERPLGRITLLDIWSALSHWQVIGAAIFGPAFVLLPFGEERLKTPLSLPFQLSLQVGEHQVVLSRAQNEKIDMALGTAEV